MLPLYSCLAHTGEKREEEEEEENEGEEGKRQKAKEETRCNAGEAFIGGVRGAKSGEEAVMSEEEGEKMKLFAS